MMGSVGMVGMGQRRPPRRRRRRRRAGGAAPHPAACARICFGGECSSGGGPDDDKHAKDDAPGDGASCDTYYLSAADAPAACQQAARAIGAGAPVTTGGLLLFGRLRSVLHLELGSAVVMRGVLRSRPPPLACVRRFHSAHHAQSSSEAPGRVWPLTTTSLTTSKCR